MYLPSGEMCGSRIAATGRDDLVLDQQASLGCPIRVARCRCYCSPGRRRVCCRCAQPLADATSWGKEKLLRFSAGERNAPEMQVRAVEERLAVAAQAIPVKTLRDVHPTSRACFHREFARRF